MSNQADNLKIITKGRPYLDRSYQKGKSKVTGGKKREIERNKIPNYIGWIFKADYGGLNT